MLVRILAGVIIFLTFVFLPWWLGLLLALIGLFFFDNYFEAPVIIFAFELLGSGQSLLLPGYFVMTAISLVVWAGLAYIKPRLLY